MNGSTGQPADSPFIPRKPRLLLVEDEYADCLFLFEVLSKHYEVEIAMTGPRAWEMAQLQPPDMVLSDVVLPGLDGFSLARRLRAHAPTSKVPIILLSANSKIDLMVRGLVAGADDVLLKPIRVEELLKILQDKLAG